MMKRIAMVLMMLVLLASFALAEGELTAYETRCGYSFDYDAKLFTPVEAGRDVLLQTNKLAYNSYININANRMQCDDPAENVQQVIRDCGASVNEHTYRTLELPAETKVFMAHFPYLDGIFEYAIVHQAGMEFVLSAYYASKPEETLYSGAFETLLRSLAVIPNGDVSGFEDNTQINECEEYVSDPVMNAFDLYAAAIQPFARTVSGLVWSNGEIPSNAAEGIDARMMLKDLNQDGMFELILMVCGDGSDDEDEDAAVDSICCLYTYDEESGYILDWLPGLGMMYSYTLCQAEDASFVLRRRGSVSDTAGIEVCHFYRFGKDGPEFVEGYIMDDMACYQAKDDSLVVSADAGTLTFDQIEEMEAHYTPYSTENDLTINVEEYFYIAGDDDAGKAWFGLM